MLTQAQMAELFGRERSVITKHVRNLFREGELDPKSVCAKFAHTAADGKTYQVEAFNLEVIISIGALHHADGTPRLSDGALVALTLMIAESRPGEKDILVRILMHLLLGEEMA